MKITRMIEIAEVKVLAERMCSFVEGTFDGYPSATCADERIVFEAHYVWKKSHPDDRFGSEASFIAFVASVCVETKEELQSARGFYEAMMNAVWTCNMIEGDNKTYADQAEEESGG